MAEDNFGLIMVSVVAIVAIVGVLNFNGMTGKLTDTNIVQTSGEKELFLSEWECKGCDNAGDNCKYKCDSFLAETTESGVSSYRLWQCGDRLCHKLYYRVS